MRASIVIASGVLCAAVHAQAQIVTNGGFTTGTLTGWAWTPDASSEPTMVASVVAGPFASGPAFRVNPGNASGSADLGGTLSQIVTLTAGVPYTVSGDLAIQNVSGSNNADGGTILVRLGGATIHTFDVQAINANTLSTDPFSVPFTPGVSGNFLLEIRTTRNFSNFVPNIYHWADNIAIVPGPSGLAVLGAGMVLAARRRR